MTTYTRVNNLKATPLPQFAITSDVGTLTMGRLNPRWHTDIPLPQFNPSSSVGSVSALAMIPIKPLPGTSGGGSAVVGTPIDSG